MGQVIKTSPWQGRIETPLFGASDTTGTYIGQSRRVAASSFAVCLQDLDRKGNIQWLNPGLATSSRI